MTVTTKMYLINYIEIVFPPINIFEGLPAMLDRVPLLFLKIVSSFGCWCILQQCDRLVRVCVWTSRTMQIEWNIQRQFLIHFAQLVQISIINFRNAHSSSKHSIWVLCEINSFVLPIERDRGAQTSWTNISDDGDDDVVFSISLLVLISVL